MSLQDRQLGRYRILEPLGSGGMSVVYRGHDTVLGRDVAVKVLHPHLADKSEARRRLGQEAQAVARLRHPNILDVYDFSTESSEQAYLITEYIRGQTLRQFLEKERFDPPEVAAMVIHSLAGALATAHEAGIIHRDLKPDNVMVREDGVLKLMDFGIAKVLDRDERMTLTGALMGSPAHMAPEVIDGEPVGPPADIFSLGTMFYLLVTGQLPFLGPNPTATLKRILDGEYEAPEIHAPALSRHLAVILAKMLAHHPGDRYQDAGELRDALADALLRAGIERPEQELATFFASPDVARQILKRRLVENALDQADAAAAAGDIHSAIDLLNQTHALDPENARAVGLLATLSLAQKARSTKRRAMFFGAGGAVVALALAGASWSGAFADPLTEGTTDAPPVAAAPGHEQSPGAQQTDAAVNGAEDEAIAAATPGRDGAGGGEDPRSSVPSDGPGEPASDVRPADTSAAVGSGAPAGSDAGPLTPPASGELVASALPSRPRPPSTIERPQRPQPSSEAPVQAEILIRPWAYVAVDDGPFSATGLQTLRVSLKPGKHTVKLRCPFCEDTEEEITLVANGRPQTFALSPALKPARLSFDVSPVGATVEIDGVTRSATDTLRDPFLFRTPKGERPAAHEVRYTLSHPGYAPRRGTVRLNVGQDHIERTALDLP